MNSEEAVVISFYVTQETVIIVFRPFSGYTNDTSTEQRYSQTITNSLLLTECILTIVDVLVVSDALCDLRQYICVLLCCVHTNGNESSFILTTLINTSKRIQNLLLRVMHPMYYKINITYETHTHTHKKKFIKR